MSNLKEFRDSYYFYSGKASDIARYLAFAGIALIWAFKAQDGDGHYGLASELWTAGVLIVIGLTLDLLQYFWATLAWGTFCRIKERSGMKPTSRLDAPTWLNWPTNLFFYSKIGFVLVAYLVLVFYLNSNIEIGSVNGGA